MSARAVEAPKKERNSWPAILETAAEIVNGYSVGVTLRHLFYRLVARQIIKNTTSVYTMLSSRTSDARLDDEFPDLIDLGREIHRYQTFANPPEALDWLTQIYRRDRTEGQPVSIYLGVEKNGSVDLLTSWFGELGIPVLALGGFASTSYIKEIAADIERQDRPAVLLYAGDFDSSGECIERDFLARMSRAYKGTAFAKVVKVALTPEQVEEYDLPEAEGKTGDTRSGGFMRKHGRLVQVELEALPPETLRGLYAKAIDQFFDASMYKASMAREAQDDADLRRALGRKRGRP
jgi:hypothetical protein